MFRAARNTQGLGVLRIVGAVVMTLASVPVILIFSLVAGEGQRASEPRCITVAACDAGLDQNSPSALPPASAN